jgi:hypothetical protein
MTAARVPADTNIGVQGDKSTDRNFGQLRAQLRSAMEVGRAYDRPSK